jgi:hypothetical protein
VRYLAGKMSQSPGCEWLQVGDAPWLNNPGSREFFDNFGTRGARAAGSRRCAPGQMRAAHRPPHAQPVSARGEGRIAVMERDVLRSSAPRAGSANWRKLSIKFCRDERGNALRARTQRALARSRRASENSERAVAWRPERAVEK